MIENLVGTWKFEEELGSDLNIVDLSDIEFIDENDGIYIRPSKYWCEPMQVIEGTCGDLTLYFPDGRTIVNPSAEELWEWAQGTQIPCYRISEDEFDERFN